MLTPRAYQLDAVERSRTAIRGGKTRVLIVAPTGAGKTIIATHIIANAVARGRRVLFIAHRRELIAQAYNKLIGCTCSAAYRHDALVRDPACAADGLPERDVGIIMAGDPRRRPTARVQVASIDTLRSRAKPLCDLVIVDEAHRALAKSYTELQRDYRGAVHLGLTATPYRADGKGLGLAYDELVVVASPRELIEMHFLVEPRVFTVPASDLPDLSRVKLKGADYDAEQLAVACDQGGLVGNIVEHWKKHAAELRTVCFAASVAHSQHIAEQFRAAGVAAEHLDGSTPTAQRDAILRRLESGETRVVSNCGVLCEGWDQPSVKCAILARPTKSAGLYLQQAGRILRPFMGLGAIILDHAGCVLEHGLPQEDREFSLEGSKKNKDKPRAPSCKTCETCFAIVASVERVCPQCGTKFAIAVGGQELAEQEGELVEVRVATQDERRQVWEELCATAAQRGWKDGAAAWKYKEKYGTWPPSSFKRPAKTYANEPQEAKHAYLAQLRELARVNGYQPGFVRARFSARYGHEIPVEWMLPAGAREVA